MRCRRVKILLADYIDKSLPPQDTALVKEHLAQCAECREEYRFLKKYRNGIEAFPSLEPPENFLDKIHDRIIAGERRSLIQKLFLPLRIKLSIEAAGVLALTLIIAFIYRPFGVNRLKYGSEETAVPAANVTLEPETKKTHPGRDFNRSAARVKEDDEIRAKDRARAPGVATSSGEVEPGTAGEKDHPGMQTVITLALSPTRAAGREPSVGESFQPENLSEAGKPRDALEKKAATDKNEQSPAERSRKSLPAPRDQAEVEGIAMLAKSLEGNVVTTTFDEKTGAHRQIIVEIPARNYDQFMTGLRADWSVHTVPPAGAQQRAHRMHIIMNFSE